MWLLIRSRRFEAYEYDGRFFVNPGSATGAFSPFWTATPAEPVAEAPTEEDTKSKEEESKARPAAEGSESKDAAPPASADAQPPTPIPSFALLDIQGAVVITCESFCSCDARMLVLTTFAASLRRIPACRWRSQR